MHDITTMTLAEIVNGLHRENDHLTVVFAVDRHTYKERDVASVWIGDGETFKNARRVVEVTVNDGSATPLISVWDRAKNRAEFGNPYLAEWTSETMDVTADEAVAFLLGGIAE